MVLEVPDAYLEEYATSILERYKLKLSANIIGKFLCANSITRKSQRVVLSALVLPTLL